MNDLVPKGLNHPAFEVRGACIKAISYLSEYLNPDIIMYHKILMPALIENISNANLKVGEKSLAAIDIFCENLEEKVREYL